MNAPANRTPENDEAIEAMAASWLVQRDEGFTPAQAAEFARWRDANPKHAAAIAMLEETCGILGRMPLLREEPDLRREMEALKQPHSSAAASRAASTSPTTAAKIVRFPTLLKVAGALAACLLVVLGGWWLRPVDEEFRNTYTTAAGGYLRVVLPDESLIELNADTEVRVHFSATLRRITLAGGEAHFTVAKNPTRPFHVAAGTVDVRAVGTAFNVKLAPAAIEVLVTEGKVQLGQSSAPANFPRSDTTAAPATAVAMLVAGQCAIVSTGRAAATAPRIATLDPAAVRDALAWQTPRLVFVDTPLAEVVQQFNRRNRLQLEIGDAELGHRVVGGSFRADHVETFVRLLEDSRDVTVERPAPDRIILRKVAAPP